ncbi:MAG: antitoxin family protein [Nitrospinae bacterium]|nr:antitoxin family protein [Nitrospinota bacterium]
MPRNIEVIYEDGVLKPLSPLKLKEHEKIRITLEEKGGSLVKATSGMFRGLDDSTIDEIALSTEFLSEEI